MIEAVIKSIQESAQIKEAMARVLAEPITRLAQEIISVFKNGGEASNYGEWRQCL